MSTLSECFDHQSIDTAIIIPPAAERSEAIHVTYAALSSQVRALQRKIAKHGISYGSAVSIALPNSLEFVVAFLASSWQRAIAAPLNPAYTQDEFEFYIGDLKSSLAIVPKGAFQANDPAVRAARKYGAAVAECYCTSAGVVLDMKDLGKVASRQQGNASVNAARPDDVALVLHTSGTTGRPKAVPLSHQNLTTSIRNITKTYNLTKTDRTLLVMPLFHVHGLLAAFLAPLGSGGSVIIPARFSATDFWRQFIDLEANWYTAVPTIHQILLRNPIPEFLPAIRFVRSCSSPLSPKTFSELETALQAPVLEAYAMTEAAHQMTSSPLPPGKRKPGSVGIGHGVEVKILDQAEQEVPHGSEAEICVRGDNVTKGYINNPEANKTSFTSDGFFRTGDQGKVDDQGYVIITGRIKELINKGGEKISPVELDNATSQHPAIAEAVAFAIDDEIYGQDIGMAVVTKEDANVSRKELVTWLQQRLAKFKIPKTIYFTKTMPKTATGKVQRRMVADAMRRKQPESKL